MAVKNIILGTAGHIDHGKTTFVKALTGIDCDRLKEEKERGITIELGYAHLMLPSGIKVGIVDVPGHEKFVSKMVAGAAGIDVVALVIAADEGIKPQTREHLYICDILGIKNGIVVLTKKDLVDAELLELQKEDIKDFIKDTNLKDAPIVAVSALTGDGLDEFVKVLDDIAKNVIEKPHGIPFRLPIDDVITIKGFGTVVRGTAISGTIKRGQEVYVLPQRLLLRVRGLQSHGKNIDEGVAGERLAINFSDVERYELERGMVVVDNEAFEPTNRILIELNYLPYNVKPLKQRFVCQFHLFTSKTNAEIFILNKDKLLPGEKAYAMVRLDKSVVASYGDQYVIRGYGIYTTLGGGRILNPKIPTFNREYYTEEYLRNLSVGNIEDIITIFTLENEDNGITLDSLLVLLKEDSSLIIRTLKDLESKSIIVKDDKKRYYHKSVIEHIKQTTINQLVKFHQENILKMGINKDELFMKVGCSDNIFPFVLKLLQEENLITIIGELVASKSFANKSETNELFVKIEQIYRDYGLIPDDLEVIAEKLKVDVKKLKEALVSLVRQGKIVKINESYFITKDVLESTKVRLIDFFSKKPFLTPQDVRELFGMSRKYIIPFLEYLDSVKFTIRVQEGRKLRK